MSVEGKKMKSCRGRRFLLQGRLFSAAGGIVRCAGRSFILPAGGAKCRSEGTDS